MLLSWSLFVFVILRSNCTHESIDGIVDSHVLWMLRCDWCLCAGVPGTSCFVCCFSWHTNLVCIAFWRGKKGIPECLWFGQEGEFNALVMELLGPSLEVKQQPTKHHTGQNRVVPPSLFLTPGLRFPLSFFPSPLFLPLAPSSGPVLLSISCPAQ